MNNRSNFLKSDMISVFKSFAYDLEYDHIKNTIDPKKYMNYYFQFLNYLVFMFYHTSILVVSLCHFVIGLIAYPLMTLTVLTPAYIAIYIVSLYHSRNLMPIFIRDVTFLLAIFNAIVINFLKYFFPITNIEIFEIIILFGGMIFMISVPFVIVLFTHAILNYIFTRLFFDSFNIKIFKITRNTILSIVSIIIFIGAQRFVLMYDGNDIEGLEIMTKVSSLILLFVGAYNQYYKNSKHVKY
jgi:hypothetical protein